MTKQQLAAIEQMRSALDEVFSLMGEIVSRSETGALTLDDAVYAAADAHATCGTGLMAYLETFNDVEATVDMLAPFRN